MDKQVEQKLSDRITFINIWIFLHFALTCFIMWALTDQLKVSIRQQDQFDRLIKTYPNTPAEDPKDALK